MISVRGRGHPRWESPSIIPPDSSPPPESKFFKQLARPLRPKFVTATTDIPKYSKDELQRIFKAVLEAQVLVPAPAPAPAPALAASKKPWDKLLKACSPNIYCVKSHIDYYNFCQQCKDYFAIARATRANRILFCLVFPLGPDQLLLAAIQAETWRR